MFSGSIIGDNLLPNTSTTSHRRLGIKETDYWDQLVQTALRTCELTRVYNNSQKKNVDYVERLIMEMFSVSLASLESNVF